MAARTPLFDMDAAIHEGCSRSTGDKASATGDKCCSDKGSSHRRQMLQPQVTKAPATGDKCSSPSMGDDQGMII